MAEDLLDLFAQWTEPRPSAPIFREWAAIALIAGALERRVWTDVGAGHCYPNLFVMLVGPPGSGKNIIEDVKTLWSATILAGSDHPAFHVAKDSYSKASLMDDLAAAEQERILPTGAKFTYHSLLAAAEEFPTFFPKFDMEFIANLAELWNCKGAYRERRRASEVKRLEITLPCLNLLMGYQPGSMAYTLPQQAWDQGWARRTIMIWNHRVEKKPMFARQSRKHALEMAQLQRLSQLASLYGPAYWEPDATAHVERWLDAGAPPQPTHSRLDGYNQTRGQFCVKLSMVAAASEASLARNSLHITLAHVIRALDWMFRAEAAMPDLFRAMRGESDINLMNDLHQAMLTYWVRREKAVPDTLMWKYFADKIPSHKIAQIIATMANAGMIVRAGEGLWRPEADRQFVE